jgi:hypothetical protein
VLQALDGPAQHLLERDRPAEVEACELVAKSRHVDGRRDRAGLHARERFEQFPGEPVLGLPALGGGGNSAATALGTDGGIQGLGQIIEDVVDVLDADAQADGAGTDARRQLLLGVICRCVVEAGWQASDLASPRLTSRLNSFSAS